MRIKYIKEVEPVSSRCIEVDSEDKLFAVGGDSGTSVLTHNSVCQRNVFLGCVMRPEHWRFLGIDLKRVELSSMRAYSNVVLGIATTIEDALTVLRFAQETMMKRYTEMEAIGVNNFLDMPNAGPALLCMVDECGELLSATGVKSLKGDTIIVSQESDKSLCDVQIGDTVYDSNGEPTVVVNKYVPEEQDRYELSITSVDTMNEQKAVAGSEHYWVAHFFNSDGIECSVDTVTTEELYRFKEEQSLKPENERMTVKFKRA